MEELAKDKTYFTSSLASLKITDVDLEERRNVANVDSHNLERGFWSRVSPHTYKEVEVLFAGDFLMFNYTFSFRGVTYPPLT